MTIFGHEQTLGKYVELEHAKLQTVTYLINRGGNRLNPFSRSDFRLHRSSVDSRGGQVRTKATLLYGKRQQAVTV